MLHKFAAGLGNSLDLFSGERSCGACRFINANLGGGTDWGGTYSPARPGPKGFLCTRFACGVTGADEPCGKARVNEALCGIGANGFMPAATFEEYLRGSEIARHRAPGMVLLKTEDEVVAYLLANIFELVTLPRSSAFSGVMPAERDEIEAAAVAALQNFGERLFAEFGPRDWREDDLLQRAADALQESVA